MRNLLQFTGFKIFIYFLSNCLFTWTKLIYLGAADNMLEEFDPNNLEKSWKWKEKVTQ